VPSTNSGPLAALVSELSNTTGWCALAGLVGSSSPASSAMAMKVRFMEEKYKEYEVGALRTF
jgi:hypothetical protein